MHTVSSFATIILFAIFCSGCKKSDTPYPPYEQVLAGTWTWAHYLNSNTPQYTGQVKMADTSLEIVTKNDRVISFKGYNFSYTDSLSFYNGNYRQAVDHSKYVCYQANAYSGEHSYMYLRYDFTTDSVLVRSSSGGVQYSTGEEFVTRITR